MTRNRYLDILKEHQSLVFKVRLESCLLRHATGNNIRVKFDASSAAMLEVIFQKIHLLNRWLQSIQVCHIDHLGENSDCIPRQSDSFSPDSLNAHCVTIKVFAVSSHLFLALPGNSICAGSTHGDAWNFLPISQRRCRVRDCLRCRNLMLILESLLSANVCGLVA